jgi:hypothetical protein
MLKRSMQWIIWPIVLVCVAMAQKPSKPLSNDDVVAMFKGGLGESTIISAIQSQNTSFDISAMSLLQLKKAGVTPKIMDAVLGAAGKRKAADDAATAVEAAEKPKTDPVVPAALVTPIPSEPSVLMRLGQQSQWIPLGHTQIVQTKAKASTLSAFTSDGTLAQAMSGVTQSAAAGGMMKGSAKMASTMMMANPMLSGAMMAGNLFAAHHKTTVTDVWALAGSKSETAIHNDQPSFEVRYDNIPGINADEYEPVLLKLESTPNNFRLVGATEAKEALQASITDWGMYSSFVEDRLAAQATKIAPGHYQLLAGSALPPGEYGVALRPLKRDKKFSSTSGNQNSGDWLLFNSLWSFEVAP